MRVRFVVCEDSGCCTGLHGHFEVKGGVSREACSRREALELLAYLVAKDAVSNIAIADARIDVAATKMPLKDEEVYPAIRAKVTKINFALAAAAAGSIKAFYGPSSPGKSGIH